MAEILRKKWGRPDLFLLLDIALLLLLSLIIMVSASQVISQQKFGSPDVYLKHHILFGMLPGLALGFAAFRVSLDFIKRHVALFFLISLALMALVFFPKIGFSFGGAKRWLDLGFFSLQPSEFLKLTAVLYLSAWLSGVQKKPEYFSWKKLKLPTSLVAFLAIIGVISGFLIKQPDVSTLVVIVASAFVMYFLAGTRWKHNLIAWTAALGSFLLLIKLSSYRLSRLLVFLEPDTDPLGIGYQFKQALITIGSGGLWGKGLGLSLQRYGFIPQTMADSIFAIFSEETGFIGGIIIISLFLIFALRGFKTAKNSKDQFCRLSAVGITCWITFQAFVNIGAMVGLVPLTGIPLPFISYGGSAMVFSLAAAGILLNISTKT